MSHPTPPHTPSVRPIHGGNLAWAAAIAGCSPDSLLDFSASISPLGPPASVQAAMAESLGQLHHYPDPEYATLRRALAEHHGLSPDWVLPGNGAAELITWAARDMAESGASAGCRLITPAFADYGRALGAVGVPSFSWPLSLAPGTAVLSPLTIPESAPESAPEASTEPAHLILNNPHNPTGLLWDRASLEPLLDRFATVVVDEAFMDFVPPAQQQSLIGRLGAHPNWVVLRSLTKFYTLPGLRLGYALGHPDRLARWQRWRDPWPVNTVAAAAAIAAVQDADFQARTWRWLTPARQTLQEALAAMPGLSPLPGAANYLLVHTETPAPVLQDQLLRRDRILIRDCLSFAELGANYFRVAVRTPPENERLVTALGQILAV